MCSVNDVLRALQQSKEDTEETISGVFSACCDRLNKFKETALKKLKETSENASDVLKVNLNLKMKSSSVTQC